MPLRRRVAVIAALLLPLGACDQPTAPNSNPARPPTTTQEPTPLAGAYAIDSASNPDRAGSYTGTVTIDAQGSVYRLGWSIRNTAPQVGVGVVQGQTFAVGYGPPGARVGVVAYQVEGGHLAGRWTEVGATATGRDELAGPPGLNGTYQETGENPDGSRYSGTATINPSGVTYAVAWTLGNTRYSGIGILTGDVLIVGYAPAGGPFGVVAYRIAGSVLAGRWAVPGVKALGTEYLRRQ